MTKTITITFVAPKDVGLTHEDYGIGSIEWPTRVTYEGKTYLIVSYENPLVDASLFTVFYISEDGERLGVDYEGSGYEDTLGPYTPSRTELKQVNASDYGIKLGMEDLSWQEKEITLEGGSIIPKQVTYAPRSYNWFMNGELYSVFFQSESASYDGEIPDLEVLNA
jgi:hypothetical protein